jgi:hypothetical protein
MKYRPKKPYKESMKQKARSLKSNCKPLANLTKMRSEKTKITKIRNKQGGIATTRKEIQGIIRDYFEKLYSNKLENLEEMNKFLHTYDHPKLNQDINHLNRSIICNEIEAAI